MKAAGRAEVEVIRQELGEQWKEDSHVGAAGRHLLDQPQRALQHHCDADGE